MRLIQMMTLAAALLTLPGVAHAQSFEVSLGSGLSYGDNVDNVDRISTNLMGTIGYGLANGIVEPQLGVLTDFGDISGEDFDFQLRPQLKLNPPVIPIYARLILSVVNLIGDGDTEIYYGGSLGLELPLPLVSPFLEAAILPTSVDGVTVFELRAGLAF